jgi:hypothetical protein
LLEIGVVRVEDPFMRVLRLDLASGQHVDLHPFVTVIAALEEPARDELAEAVRTVARGSTAGVRGLVQRQGLLVELDGGGIDRLTEVTSANVVIDTEASGDDDLTWLRAEIERQKRKAEIEAVLVEETRADLDPSARAQVAALQHRLAPFLHGEGDGGEPVWAILDDVENALAAVEAIEPMIQEAAPGIASLRKRWAAHVRLTEESTEHLESLALPIERAQARLERARQTLAHAEAAAVPVLLGREEEARLETLAFPSMDDSRKGRWRKTLRPEEEAELQALLDKVGVESWTAYTVHRMAPSAPLERLQAVADAQAGVDDAEVHLAEMQTSREQDRIYRQIKEDGDALRAKARVYFGLVLPKDLAAALENAVVMRDNPAWIEACDELELVLERHGVAQLPRAANLLIAPDENGRDVRRTHRMELLASTRSWLEKERAASSLEDAESLASELEQARTTLRRHERALAHIDRAEASATAAVLTLAHLEEQLAARTREPAGSIDALLARIEPIATRASVEGRGSVPVAIVGEFSGLTSDGVARLLDRLSDLTASLQIVVVTENPVAAEWAERIGLDRAILNRTDRSTVAPSA